MIGKGKQTGVGVVSGDDRIPILALVGDMVVVVASAVGLQISIDVTENRRRKPHVIPGELRSLRTRWQTEDDADDDCKCMGVPPAA